jgi:protein-S-isoprenylcysteine O-methyltransferase Ste14
LHDGGEVNGLDARGEVVMSFVPEFDIGWWNAWIVLVAFYVASFVPFMLAPETTEARMEGEPSWRETGPGMRAATIITHGVLMPLAPLYGLFVPLERGTWWLFLGLAVGAVAVVMALTASLSFSRAPLDEPITHGVYACSRHPMYVAGVTIYLAVGLAATSWVFLACAAIELVAWWFAVPEEERTMLAKYGAAYEEYRRTTPRWVGVPRRTRHLVPSA